jgi:hypothetical protein
LSGTWWTVRSRCPSSEFGTHPGSSRMDARRCGRDHNWMTPLWKQ